MIGIALLGMAGCAGHNEVEYRELTPPKGGKQFTSLGYEAEKPPEGIPPELMNALKTQGGNQVEAVTKHSEEGRKREGDTVTRKMTIRYRVKEYDPGDALLRRFLGFFGVGASRMVAEGDFLDIDKKLLGQISVVSVIQGRDSLIFSDQDIHGQHLWAELTRYFLEQFYREFKKK